MRSEEHLCRFLVKLGHVGYLKLRYMINKEFGFV